MAGSSHHQLPAELHGLSPPSPGSRTDEDSPPFFFSYGGCSPPPNDCRVCIWVFFAVLLFFQISLPPSLLMRKVALFFLPPSRWEPLGPFPGYGSIVAPFPWLLFIWGRPSPFPPCFKTLGKTYSHLFFFPSCTNFSSFFPHFRPSFRVPPPLPS